MNIAVMQPYFFPYLGYFQLAASVEKFVFFDDVNFIKKGFIHRNQILVNKEPHRFTLPLKKVSQNDLIKDVYVSEIFPDWKTKFLRTIESNYSKSLNYKEILMLLEEVLSKDSLSEMASQSIINVLKYLDINTATSFSSSIDYARTGTGQDKILSICQLLGATKYTNAIGGKELYDEFAFQNADLQLNFIKMDQNAIGELIPNHPIHLSILHYLFHFDKASVLKGLMQSKLVSNRNYQE